MRVSILETQSYKSKISVQQSLLEITQQMRNYENIKFKNLQIVFSNVKQSNVNFFENLIITYHIQRNTPDA